MYEWSSPVGLHLSDVGGLGISNFGCRRLKWCEGRERVVIGVGLLTVDAEYWTACMANELTILLEAHVCLWLLPPKSSNFLTV